MKQSAQYYVGLDLHKLIVAFCVKRADGAIVSEGTVASRAEALTAWAEGLPGPWAGAMEATVFTGWVYDLLLPRAVRLEVANPLRLRAISTAKKKTDKVDARTLADMLRADLVPTCYMAPEWVRELRRVLRFRNGLVHHATTLKNRTAGLMMECGVEYEARKLHLKRYGAELLKRLEADKKFPQSVVQMARINSGLVKTFAETQRRLVKGLRVHKRLADRVERLKTIPGVGDITALTWALEIGDPQRFPSARRAISYCGLCAAHKESAGKARRGPLSKQRNKNLQWVLVEAAHLVAKRHPRLREIYEKECQRGHKRRAILAVARQLVRWLLAVDKSNEPFEDRWAAKEDGAPEGDGQRDVKTAGKKAAKSAGKKAAKNARAKAPAADRNTAAH